MNNNNYESQNGDFGLNFLSNMKFINDYSKSDPQTGKKETWEDAAKDVMSMHRDKYASIMTDELKAQIDFAEKMYVEQRVLASQRNLQFRKEQVYKHNSKLYNCSVTYLDRVRAFSEIFYQLLCGCGVGFSVQHRNISKLPTISAVTDEEMLVTVDDSIEGWADTLGYLLSSYFDADQQFPQAYGKKIVFDYSQIRPKGAFISGGYKAPGHEGLELALEKVRNILNGAVSEKRLSSINVHDIVCHASDAVLSGGVRRSALISIFDLDDEKMLAAKTGTWYIDNPQRARANNSAIIIRNKHTKEQFMKLITMTKEFGEPGIFFAEQEDIITNPCAEIGFVPVDPETGQSGWSMCNLTEINGSAIKSEQDFFDACRAATIIGTLQAGYTDFKYLTEVSKRIIEREALLGVSITGWMNNPSLFDAQLLRRGAEEVKKTNEYIAGLIGINRAARTTCVKPSGNASALLKTTSGIHGEHSPRYFRIMQLNKETELAKYLEQNMPQLLSESVYSATKSDYAVYVPVVAAKESIYKHQLYNEKLLNYVKLVQENWVDPGTNVDSCIKPYIRHNVSNTIDVDNWGSVIEWVWNNRNIMGGLSFIPASGDKIYQQAPFTSVLLDEDIKEKYGIDVAQGEYLVDYAVDAFDGIVWNACYYAEMNAKNIQPTITEDDNETSKQDKFAVLMNIYANNFFYGDLTLCGEYLKDVFLYRKWVDIQANIKDVDFYSIDWKPKYTDINTLGAVACAGGACEVTF